MIDTEFLNGERNVYNFNVYTVITLPGRKLLSSVCSVLTLVWTGSFKRRLKGKKEKKKERERAREERQTKGESKASSGEKLNFQKTALLRMRWKASRERIHSIWKVSVKVF